MVLADADGSTIRLAESAGQRQRTMELNPQRKLVGEYDSAGRLTNLTDTGRPLLRQEWESDGRLRLAANGTTAVHPEYDADGLLSRVVLAPPGVDPTKGGPWQETKLDPVGKPLEITDYSGLQVRLGYEKTDELQGLAIQRDGKDYGFTLKRDPSGRLQAVDSSWDKQRFGYNAQGLLNRAEVVRGNARSAAEWNAGRLVKVSQFDGGETQLSYNDSGSVRQITTPNGLVLDYQYDPTGRLQEVALGGTTGVSLAYDESGRVKRWSYHAGGK
jgi:YD repeat-containing protein